MKLKDRGADSDRKPDSLKKLAERRSPGLAAEIVDFLRHNKKWWLAPIIVFLLCLGVLAILGGTGAAPFIYTIF